MVVVPDPAQQESLARENVPDPLAGEQTWPTDNVRALLALCCPGPGAGDNFQTGLLNVRVRCQSLLSAHEVTTSSVGNHQKEKTVEHRSVAQLLHFTLHDHMHLTLLFSPGLAPTLEDGTMLDARLLGCAHAAQTCCTACNYYKLVANQPCAHPQEMAEAEEAGRKRRRLPKGTSEYQVRTGSK